ncbi:MAG: hypothetical protein H0V49_01445 [Nocardioidaceae bacterium]|nr:hypothetical protein [Nocardioidaceae bacterium]
MADLVRAYATRPEVRQIAVVANAPLTPSAQRAQLIDACDLVLRCNSFILDRPDEPPQQGSRVDVVVLNRGLRATPFSFAGYRERLYLMVEPGRLHWEPEVNPDWWPADLGLLPVPNREITLPLSDALGLPTRDEAMWATTGLMAAWIAAVLFPQAELLLSGFSMLDNPDQKVWRHAWGDVCIVGPEHRIAAEGRLLRSWIDIGRARLLA